MLCAAAEPTNSALGGQPCLNRQPERRENMRLPQRVVLAQRYSYELEAPSLENRCQLPFTLACKDQQPTAACSLRCNDTGRQ